MECAWDGVRDHRGTPRFGTSREPVEALSAGEFNSLRTSDKHQLTLGKAFHCTTTSKTVCVCMCVVLHLAFPSFF